MAGYISEYSYFGFADTEFIEIALPQGTDASGYSIVLYQGDGTMVESWSLGSVQSTTDGQDVYVVDNSTPGFNTMDGSGEIWADDAIALVDGSGNVVQFLSHEGFTVTATEGPAAGMTSTNAGSVNSMGDSLETRDSGQSYQSNSSPNKGSIACYAQGTRIATIDGPRNVEDLRVGDQVLSPTGPKPIVWCWRGKQPLDGVSAAQKPVQIKAGALGGGTPKRDLVVSGQHRMLLGGMGAFGASLKSEEFAPAKALTDLPGIRLMKGKRHIVWYHFALEQHDLVRAEGAWCETLLLGPMVLSNLTIPARKRLHALYLGGPNQGALNGPPARPCLSVGQARALLAGLRLDA